MRGGVPFVIIELLCFGVPSIIVAAALGFIKRSPAEVTLFIGCTSKQSIKTCWESVTGNKAGLIMFLLVSALFFASCAAGIIFLVLNLISCRRIPCIGYTGRVMMGVFFTMAADWVVSFTCAFLLGTNKFKPGTEAYTYTYMLSAYCGLNMVSLGAAWLVTVIMGSLLIPHSVCCGKCIVHLVGDAVAFIVIAVIVATDPFRIIPQYLDKVVNVNGIRAMGCVLGVLDIILYSITFTVCFCCLRSH